MLDAIHKHKILPVIHFVKNTVLSAANTVTFFIAEFLHAKRTRIR